MRQTSIATLTTGVLALAAVGASAADSSDAASPSTPSWLSRTFGDALPKALADGKFGLNARLRYERADLETTRPADAFTVRTRFGFTTAPLHGFQAMIEGKNTKVLGPNVNYNDGSGNNPGHAIVADPELTEVNRAWLSYTRWDTTLKAGRQRIIHDGARFLGNVGWRQAEQTFDAVRLINQSVEDLAIDYA